MRKLLRIQRLNPFCSNLKRLEGVVCSSCHVTRIVSLKTPDHDVICFSLESLQSQSPGIETKALPSRSTGNLQLTADNGMPPTMWGQDQSLQDELRQ